MCWVIPPVSPSATLLCRIVSKSVVLPWSTCPRIVTTGGRVSIPSPFSADAPRPGPVAPACSFTIGRGRYPRSVVTIAAVS